MRWVGHSRRLAVRVGISIVLWIAAGGVYAQTDLDNPADPCATTVAPDFNADGTVDFLDFAILAQYWDQNEPSVDVALDLPGAEIIDVNDLAALAAHWLEDTSAPVYIQWLGHASVKIWTQQQVVYVDPRNLDAEPHDATAVLVTHSHSDHYSPDDIDGVSDANTVLLAPADVIADYGAGQVLEPNETVELPGMSITGVPAYTIYSTRHPKANKWLGFVVQMGARRVYCAGDTDLTEEVKALQDIDVAFLPVSGTFAMDAEDAAEATAYLQPRLAIPYHWGDFKGTLADAEEFAALAACDVIVMSLGDILCSDDWPHISSAVAP